MLSPMILIASLFAPTVPSEPNPQNLHLVAPAGAALILSPTGSERFVTSSTIPIVKPFLGSAASRLSNTLTSCVGVVSLEPRPNLPPMISGAFSLPM